MDFALESREPIPGGLFALLMICGAFGAFISVGQLVQVMNLGFGLWFTELFVFFALAWIGLQMRGHRPMDFAGLRWAGVGPAAYGFALGAANYFAVVIPVQAGSTVLFEDLLPEWMLHDQTLLFQNRTPAELALIVTGAVVGAAICEEVFFRGLFQRSLAEQLPVRTAVIVTAALFSAFHLDLVGFAARLELGLLFGVLFLRTGSIWPGVMAHAANNGVSIGLYYLMKDQMDLEAEPELLPVLIVGAAGLIALGLLVMLARAVPSLLPRPVERPVEGAPVPESFPFRQLIGWTGAAVGALVLLLAVDWRGVQLNFVDARFPQPPASRKLKLSDGEQRARDELQALRQRARRGEVPIDEYIDQRRLSSPENR
jgi:membrane protease YdiL (CAAX protease family)